VHGGEQPALDAEAVVQHLGHRREPIGGAGGIGDHLVLGRVVLAFVDAEDDGDVLVLRGRGDDDLLRAARRGVATRLGRVGEEPGGLDHQVHAHVGPLDLLEVALRRHRHALAVHVRWPSTAATEPS
jgi:hypothetical protein